MAVEGLWTELTVPEGSGADYGVRVEGAELEPYVKKGGTVSGRIIIAFCALFF